MSVYRKIERQKLYEMVWSKPTTQVAQDLEISDVAVGKICKKMGVPKPSLGYWNRIASGQKLEKLPLLKGSYPNEHTYHANPKPQGAEPDWLVEVKSFESRPENRIAALSSLDNIHPWVAKAQQFVGRAEFRKSKAVVHVSGVRKPTLYISNGTAERALKIMQAFLDALLIRKIKVWLDKDRMFVQIQDEEIELGIRERMSRHYLTPDEKNVLKAENKSQWYQPPNFIDQPGGKLHFFMKNTEFFYIHDSRWVADSSSRPLENRLNDFVIALYKIAADIKVLREERRLQSIEQEKQRIIHEEARQRREVIERRMEKFVTWFRKWEELNRLRNCLGDLETQASKLPSDHEAHEVLKVARQRMEKADLFGNGELWLDDDSRGSWRYRQRNW